MNIGFDMDGVVVDFMEPVCNFLGIKEEDLTQYKLDEAFPEKSEIIRDFYGRKGYFRDLKAYPGAVELIYRLLDKGHNVWFCSKPAAHSSHSWIDKIDWVKEYVPELQNRTILTRDKSVCAFDIFIDDDPENLRDSISRILILFEQPWNRNCKEYIKVGDYESLEYIIDSCHGSVLQNTFPFYKDIRIPIS